MSMLTKWGIDPAVKWLASIISSPAASDPQKAAATAALTAVNKTVTDATASAPAVLGAIASGQSPAAAISPVISDLQSGINDVITAYAGTLIAGVPIIGGIIAPEASALIKTGLVYGEQDAINWVQGLFAAHHATVDAMTSPVAIPQLKTVGA